MDRAPTIAAVVVTFRRKELLPSCLDGLLSQSRKVDELIVVDNGSNDGTSDLIRARYPQITLLERDTNQGFGPGLASGMEKAYTSGHDWIWLFDDDDRPLSHALETFLQVLESLADPLAAMISSWSYGPDGRVLAEGAIWKGGRHGITRGLAPAPPPLGPYRMDAVTFSGMMIHRSVIDCIGLPRTDFYLMYEDMEYCLRAKTAGFHLYVVPEPLAVVLRAGAANRPPWRGYYQTRNHLLTVRSRRSRTEIFWWGVRQLGFVTSAVLRQDRKMERISLRLKGALDGIRGVSGKTVSP